MGKKKKKKNKLTFYDEKSNNIIDDPEKNIVKYDLEFRNFDIENDVVKPNEEVDNNDEKERLEDDYSLLGSNDIDWAIYDDFNCINDDYSGANDNDIECSVDCDNYNAKNDVEKTEDGYYELNDNDLEWLVYDEDVFQDSSNNENIENTKLKDEKNVKEKYVYVGYKERLAINILAFVITFCIFLYSIFSAFSLNQTHVITYQESSDIDYKVYLKDNSFYEDDYLKKDMSYISTLIDKINATFNYDFRIDKNIDMKFTYDIIGKLTIMDNAGKNTFYEKDFSLINNKVVDMIDTNHCIINENLDINYGYYNSIANDFRNKFGVSTISNFVVTLKINRISIDNDIDDSNDQTMSLTIPLSQREVNIKLSTDTLNNNDSVEKESGIVIVNYLSLIVSVVSFVITIVLLIKLIKKINLIRSRKTEYDKYIEKILKVYDRFIANTTIKPIVNDGDKVIELKDFQELLDVRDSFKVPINYYNIVPHHKCLFYLNKDNLIYEYYVKAVDLEKKKQK